VGRLSIRIDLPKEGEVYHFAQLGAEGGVKLGASREGGRVWEGLIALICAAAAVFVMVWRRRAVS
jgi:hypothetical protein